MFVKNKRAKATSRDRSLGKLNCNEKSVGKLAVCAQEAVSELDLYRRILISNINFYSLQAAEDEKLLGAKEKDI